MSKQERKKPIYAFIDSQNLNLATRDMGWQLDFRRFKIYLKDKFKVEKAYIFIGYIKKNESLYANLRRFGYNLIFKPTLEYHKNKKFYTKGNVDAELVLHAMIECPHYNKAVIVTGDGDFHCLIDYLKRQNKLEKLIVPDRNKFSSLLRKFAPDMAFMNDLRGKLEYK